MKVPSSDSFLDHYLPGDNDAMRALRAAIARLNHKYHPPPHRGRSVLLLGETGVGKNYVARVIAAHLYWIRTPAVWSPDEPAKRRRSPREVTGHRFIEIPLPAIPNDLVESELFGHVKGAFTGATSDKTGYFAADEVQDLLLDEIGDASPSLQAKLLTVLSDATFHRVGASPDELQTVEARIMYATNRDLAAMVRSGAFREDLYWRLQHLVLTIPPLRELRDLIPRLADALLATIRRDDPEERELPQLTKADLSWAAVQRWPGNVRELERLLWRWDYEDGEISLEEIQKRYPAPDLVAAPKADLVEAAVRERVLAALERGEKLADTVGDFARQIETSAQVALARLQTELRLDRKKLESLFGDGDRAAKQLSAWRSRE